MKSSFLRASTESIIEREGWGGLGLRGDGGSTGMRGMALTMDGGTTI